VASELGVDRVLVPPHAGVLSAFGLLVADIARDYVQTRVAVVTELAREDIRAGFEALIDKATAEFVSHGFDAADLVFHPACDARYQGQAFELPIQVERASVDAESIAAGLHAAHRLRYGFAFEGQSVELVNFRLKVVIPRSGKDVPKARVGEGPVRAEAGGILLDGAAVATTFFKSESLTRDVVVAGPAIIEADASTCFVPPGWTAGVVEGGGVLLQRIS
jgi:N-methylhydantoinase A